MRYMTDIWFIWFGRSFHKISSLKDLFVLLRGVNRGMQIRQAVQKNC